MRWRTTQDIFKDLTEHFDPNWMNYDTIQTPPKPEWDYSRTLQIEDVDIWEVIYEQGGSAGVYAAWCPYAEFYMITTGVDNSNPGKIIDGFIYHHRKFETFYGSGAGQRVTERLKQYGIPFQLRSIWVDSEDLWLHQPIQK